MEQRRSEDDTKQQQDHHHRRLNPAMQSENQPHHPHPPQQPQKCPRCDSLNTKFCYYNNYSLSQPRYFCKACRRYWTQGGTLRNVPVGGGCRKAKRAKAAASSSSSCGENSRFQSSPPPAPTTGLLAHHELQVTNKEALLGNLGIPPMSSYNSGGGFLSSLAAMQFQSLTQLPQQPPFVNQQVLNNVGAQFGASSNLSILSLSSQQQAQNQQQNHEFYHMGINRDVESLYPPLDQALIQPNRFSGSWINPNLINTSTTTTNINPTGSNPSFGNSSSSTTGTTSLNPNQWPDHLPGYGSP